MCDSQYCSQAMGLSPPEIHTSFTMIPVFCQSRIIGLCVDFERLTTKRMCYEDDASALLFCG